LRIDESDSKEPASYGQSVGAEFNRQSQHEITLTHRNAGGTGNQPPSDAEDDGGHDGDKADVEYIGSNNGGKAVDFWGPAMVVTVYCALLWLGSQSAVPYVYIIWLLGALLAHLTCRPFLASSTFFFHLSILGYSLVPQIPMCFIIIVGRPSLFASTILQMIGVSWSATAAVMSYTVICRPKIPRIEDKKKLLLLIPVVILFQIYTVSLMPMRRWQINSGEKVKIF